MVEKTSNTADPAPSQDLDDETTREAFLKVRNVAKCSCCDEMGNFILKAVNNVDRQMVKYKSCSKGFSGKNLRLLVAVAKGTSATVTLRAALKSVWTKPTQPSGSTSGTTNPEASAEEFVRFKLAPTTLMSENEKVRDEIKVLQSQYATLLAKFEDPDEWAACLQKANEKLGAGVSGLKPHIWDLTWKNANLLERIPTAGTRTDGAANAPHFGAAIEGVRDSIYKH